MLDPLFAALNQQRMAENAQKQSSELRTQQQKETRKVTRAADLDSCQISADLNEMGDDLLGSMDPDERSGRNQGAELFRQIWEETVEARKRPEPAAVLQVDEELPREEEPPPPEEPEQREEDAGEGDPPETGIRTPEEAAPEEAFEGQGREPPSQAVSLLDHSEGFLLSRDGVQLEPVAEGEVQPEDAEPVAPDVAAMLEKLVEGDRSSPGYPRLQQLLARFGAGVLDHCLKAKVRVFLMPRGSGLSACPEMKAAGITDVDGSGAAYFPERRAVVVEEECLLRPPRGFHPVLYYFACAFDHALGGEKFASLQSPAVQASFDSCRQGPGGGTFCDGLAASSPTRYFAQAVEAYLSENDCREPLWTRGDLYDFDRSMYSYVEYLFQKMNRS